MASNIDVTQGSGKTVATDEVSSAQYQKVKIVDGRTGSVSAMVVNSDGSINIAGSVVAVVTSNPNQSVSGAINIGGSVLLGSSNGSVIAVVQGSVATAPVANQSVSGALNVSGSVLLGSSNASVISLVTGSIVALATGNQSVSGAVQIYGNSSIATVHIVDDQIVSSMVALVTDTIIHGRTSAGGGGYVEVKVDPSGAMVTAMSSVVSFQGGVQTTSVISSTPSSMLAGASIFGQLPAGTAVLGSIATLQGTNPWVVVGSVYGSGSVVSFQGGTQITSLVSTVPSSVIVGASIFGQLPAGTAPIGSVATLQGTNPWIVVGSVYGSGSVVSFQGGTQITSLVSTVPSSVIVGASIFGQLPAGTAPIGSVATLQGTNPWQVAVGGSVIAVLNAPSIVGTYAEDSAHATADKGFFVMQVRNDSMSSVTSADGDYSPIAGGPVGETIVANAPITKWVQGTASMLGGTPLTGGSVAVIAAQGSSIFTYITGLHIINAGATTQWLRLDGATSSFIGFAIAPAGGGTNMYFPNGLKTNANGAFTASISGSGSGASVYVTAQGFISKT